jgi:hypothetical protein
VNKFVSLLQVLFFAIAGKAAEFQFVPKNINKTSKIIFPGDSIPLHEKNVSYDELLQLLKTFGNPHDKTKKISIQDEDTLVDLSFLDDSSILVSSERARNGAPPNADGAF